jgi:hypothetical protein
MKKEQVAIRSGGYLFFFRKSGAPGGTRTHNLLIRSQALYPLSYGGLGSDYTPILYREILWPTIINTK